MTDARNNVTDVPSPADLKRRVLLAFGMAGEAFATSRHEAGDGTPGAPLLLPAKVAGEAALLLRTATPLAAVDPEVAEGHRDLARTLAKDARGTALLLEMAIDPAAGVTRASVHIHLRELGWPDPAVDRMLEELVAVDSGGPERLPNRDLERRWLLDIWRGGNGVSRSIVRRTCLRSHLDALGSRVIDLYLFTHAILYATDAGRRRLNIGRSPRAIEADASAGLAAALDADNLDLAAELLWLWPMARLPWTAPARFAFGLLSAAQDRAGFLPGPGYMGTLDGDAERLHVLRSSYHATLVMGMLCAAAWAHPPPARVPSSATDATTVNELLAQLGSGRRWTEAAAALAPGERAGLAPTALAALLRRRAAACDLAGLADCLALAVRQGLAEDIAVRQAAALLRRATIVASAG